MLIIFVVGAFSSQQQQQLSDDMGESSPVSEYSGGFVDGKKQGKREENCEHGVRGIFRKALQDLSVETVEGLFVERTRQEDEENGKMVRGKRYLQALIIICSHVKLQIKSDNVLNTCWRLQF